MTFDDPDKAPVSAFFMRWSTIVLRYRFLLLFGTLALSATFAFQVLTKIRFDTSIEAFLAKSSDAYETLEELRDDFGRDEMFLVLIRGDVYSKPFLERLRGLHNELEAINIEVESLGKRSNEIKSDSGLLTMLGIGSDEPSDVPADPGAETHPTDAFEEFGDEGWGDEGGGTVVDEIVSLVNVRRTTWRDGGLHVGGLLEELPSETTLPALKRIVQKESSMIGRVVDESGQHAVIMIRTDFMSEADQRLVYDEVRRICDKHETDAFEAKVAGMPALSSAMNQLMISDLQSMGILAVLMMFLMMFWIFRHPLGVIGPVLVVIQAVVWTFGTMATLGVSLTMVSNILPAFVICVGIGDSVHIQSVYRDARQRGAENREAIRHALATTGIPVLFTSITTAVGLLSFRFAKVDAIGDMGTFAAMGVVVALLHSVVFLPIILSFNTKSMLGVTSTTRVESDLIDRFLAWCNRASMPLTQGGRISFQRRNKVLAVSLFFAALAIAGASTLRVHHNPLAWIPDGYEVKDAFTEIDASLGGSADITLLIETRKGSNIKDRELMLKLDKLEDHISAYQHPVEKDVIGSVISVADVVRETNRATHEMQDAFYGIPDTPRGVADMVTIFENSSPDDLRRLTTVDLTRSVMTTRVRWLDAGSYAPMAEYILQGVDEHLGGLANVRATGAVLNLLTVVGGLLDDMLRSFGAAFVVITLMMILLLRDLKLGLIAMVPNLLPIVSVMGFMGFASIPIDLNNILIGSIAIGIAVDDTIHFLHQFRAHISRHENVEEAISHAFSHAGRAMTTTSLILVAGFSVFLAADMYNVMRFGILVAMTLVFALLVDLIFAPAILRLVYRSTNETGAIDQGDNDVLTTAAAE